MSAPGPVPVELRPLENGWRLLRSRWWILALCIGICAPLFLARALTTEKTYEATASVLVRESSLLTLIDPGSRGGDPVREAATNLLLAKSNDVAELVRAQVPTGLDVPELLDRIDVVNQPDTDVLDVTASDPDPDQAARLANAFADQFVVFRRQSARDLAAEGARTLRRQLAALPAGSTTQRRELEQALEKVGALQAVTTGDVEVVGRATPPTAAAAPLPKRSLLVGITLGLLLGLGLVVLLELLDRRLRRPEEVGALLRLRVLTVLPRGGRDGAAEGQLEALRILRGDLEALAPGARTVLVTSGVPGEGGSTVAVGLARVLALAGKRVALVETDLRRPSLAQELGLPPATRGLTTALVGGTPSVALLEPVVPGLRSLLLLPAGPAAPNAAELLRSDAMARVLAELHGSVDVVVLDAPPLLPVADTRVLLDGGAVDACVLVARLGLTRDDEVRRARAVLDAHLTVPAGVAVLEG